MGSGGRRVNPRPANQAALDTSLNRAEPEVQMRFESLRGRHHTDALALPMVAGGALEYHPSMSETLLTVEGLGKADMERRTLLRNSLFAVGASITPSRDWLLATIDEAVAPRDYTNNAQVEAVRQVFGVFQQLDVRVGGGQARKQLIGYFTQIVAPLLRTTDASTASGQALFEAGAEQLYLIGDGFRQRRQCTCSAVSHTGATACSRGTIHRAGSTYFSGLVRSGNTNWPP